MVDAEGNAVSCTTTLNNSYGSAVTVAGAGFLLNDEMDDFTTVPGQPNLYGLVQGEANAIAPGKRMLSAMTPTLVLDPAGRLFLVLGTPGGPRIITMVYHVISNVIDRDMGIADAVAEPRLHHQWSPDEVVVERGFSPDLVRALAARGHHIVERMPGTSANSILVTPRGLIGAADHRTRGALAAGY